jgi:hypothetical protein
MRGAAPTESEPIDMAKRTARKKATRKTASRRPTRKKATSRSAARKSTRKTTASRGKMKVVKQHKPAQPRRKGINPFTKEEQWFKAKPARNVVKVRPLKSLKDLV